MLLPYVAYLRVYEPLHRLAVVEPSPPSAESALETVATLTLAQEQQTVLRHCVAPASGGPYDDLAGWYLLQRDGSSFACPLDLPLRSWLALASFVEDTDNMTQSLFFVPDHAERAVDQFAAWRLSNPTAAPHIRSATWGVPRTWFLLVHEAERETYDERGSVSVRYRAPLDKARARLAAAHSLLDAVIGDEDLVDELDDLDGWLGSFEDGWLELDYAGVARLLGAALGEDRSAAEIHQAVAALRRRDFAAAGESYRSFVERWRAVNALERAS